jgi:DNA-binding NtrC family response regulator
LYVDIRKHLFKNIARGQQALISPSVVCYKSGRNLKKAKYGKRLRILLLDGEPIVGNQPKPALAKAGCDIRVFQDPQKALERIDKRNFDIVVTDIVMADLNRIQVLEHMQKKSDETKVIITTGFGTVVLARSHGKGGV